MFGDIAAFQSLMYVLTFEACIACGYIHSNSRYADLFASSAGTSAQITDKAYHVRYAALNTQPISEADMRRAEQGPIALSNGLLLHTMPVNGGYAVWTEDVSALLAVKEASESLAEELKERNALLRYEYKRDARRCMIEEQNRLYDLLQSATQRQIDRIAVLTKDYQKLSETDLSEAQKRLSEIAVLCSYIKRRKHLTLLADRDYKVAVTELERAFSESLQTLKLLDVHTLHTQTLIIGQKFDFGEIRFLLVCRLLYRPIKISFRYKIGQAYQRYPLEMFLVGIVDTLHTVLPPEAL